MLEEQQPRKQRPCPHTTSAAATSREVASYNINKLIGYGTAGKMTKVNGQEINYLVYMVLEYTPKIFYDLCAIFMYMDSSSAICTLKKSSCM